MSGSDALEKELAKSSVGLVKAEDYKRKREELQMNEVIGKARADQLAQATAEEGKKKKKKKPAKPSGLSFDDELADGEAEVSPNMGNKKMGKSKDVDTSFLRMNSRDAEASAQEKEQAMREFLIRQNAAKDEVLKANYIYRSEVTQREIPNGVHRGLVELKRGLTKPVTEEATVVARPRTAKQGRGRVAGGLGGAVADGADGAPPHVRLRKALSKHSTRVVDVSRATALPPAAALRGRV